MFLINESIVFNPDSLEPFSNSSSAFVVPSSGLRCGALSANVAWLDTEHRYVRTRQDANCHDGRFADLDHICWVAMGPYVFPPPEANMDVIPAGEIVWSHMGKKLLDDVNWFRIVAK